VAGHSRREGTELGGLNSPRSDKKAGRDQEKPHHSVPSPCTAEPSQEADPIAAPAVIGVDLMEQERKTARLFPIGRALLAEIATT
jgi:hypothetical protein